MKCVGGMSTMQERTCRHMCVKGTGASTHAPDVHGLCTFGTKTKTILDVRAWRIGQGQGNGVALA